MTKPSTNRSMLLALAALVAACLAPSLAAATPSKYQVKKGKIGIEISLRGSTYEVTAPIRGGSFVYDHETRIVSDLSVSVLGHEFAFDASIDLATYGGIRRVDSTTVAVKIGGLPLPGGYAHGYWARFTPQVTLYLKAERVGSVVIDPKPTNPMPEPGAALLFAVGLVAVASWPRRTAVASQV